MSPGATIRSIADSLAGLAAAGFGLSAADLRSLSRTLHLSEDIRDRGPVLRPEPRPPLLRAVAIGAAENRPPLLQGWMRNAAAPLDIPPFPSNEGKI